MASAILLYDLTRLSPGDGGGGGGRGQKILSLHQQFIPKSSNLNLTLKQPQLCMSLVSCTFLESLEETAYIHHMEDKSMWRGKMILVIKGKQLKKKFSVIQYFIFCPKK